MRSEDKQAVVKENVSKEAGFEVFVTDVRIGQHPGKTRIVIDLSAASRFQTSFKDGDKILSVKLPSVSWAADDNVSVKEDSLLRSYKADDNQHGSIVEFALDRPSKLAYQKAFKPSEGRGNRIVLDLVSQ